MTRRQLYDSSGQQAALYILWKVVYNRHIHPLSHYPGPFLASVSRIPFATAYIRGHLHTYVRNLHQTYGDVVRVAPDELSYQNEQAWKDIYGFGRNFPKDTRFFNVARNGACNMAVAPTDEIHRRQRRVLGGAFSDTALKHQEHLLQQYVDNMIQRLQQQSTSATEAVDLTEWFNYTTFDFMAKYVFGESLSCLEDAQYHPWVKMIFAAIRAWAVISLSKYIPVLSYPIKIVTLCLYRRLLKDREANFRFSATRLAQRMSRPDDPSPPDFISHVKSSQGPKAVLSDDEIRANASFFMIAGSETTATLLSGCIFLLLTRQDTYRELVSQVRARYPTPSAVTFASTADFPYLRAVVHESLRMYPPTPLGMPRVVPEGGAMIAGRFVPGKTAVSVPHYAAYRSPANFSHPNDFLPERWMDNAGDEYSDDQKEIFQPFSAGPRACAGKSLAYAETYLILTRLLWHFDLDLHPQCADWINQQAFVVWNKKPLLVRLTVHNAA
ncbi:cytochrome protein [Aspergillus campestris IBT 28561]|uniref:Cytochrome protein n=1 Tax=Aspergillus campestris (strain IBT 28561) TaxID=1392248 RepID=A0A2I1D7D6_ASPC2|nr:cytochrome protein [Aspergillus campestris IBT 28561]PKY05791.1 cytochrome protein [Aspergillus campestris IBT 28561]